MWKRVNYVILLLSIIPVFSKLSPNDSLIDEIIAAIDNTLNYINKNYEKLNVDCLFGVTFAGAILDDAFHLSKQYQPQISKLKSINDKIVKNALNIMPTQATWNFTQYIVDRDLWKKQIQYKTNELHNLKPQFIQFFELSTGIFSNIYNEGFSDSCLSQIVHSSLGPPPRSCKISQECQEFIKKLQTGTGYIVTHRLLMLQVMKVRQCKINSAQVALTVKNLCSVIYTDLISIDSFEGIDNYLDLVLEQILLCGYEGFDDFLQRKWLYIILNAQKSSGCFPSKVDSSRKKREANLLEDGCVDHTTGLGAATLSLYLHYLLKTNDMITN